MAGKWRGCEKMNLEGLTERVTNNPVARYRIKYYENLEGKIVAKVCTKCSTTKPLERYALAKKGFGGRRSVCKECMAKYREQNKERAKENDRMYYERNKDRVIERAKKWRELNTEKVASSKRVYYLKNREVALKYSRKYREQNREKDAKRKRNWRKAKPDMVTLSTQRRRARKKSLPNSFTTEQMQETLKYFGGCALTGSDEFYWDHVIPIATGHGGTVYGNMIPLRPDLNQSKSDANIFEWFEANRQRFNLSQSKFDRLVEWLCKNNNMTNEQYRAYVDECHDK
jgi:hypothetical protein